MNEHSRALYQENRSPITVMWADRDYYNHFGVTIQKIVEMIDGGVSIVSNGKNMFSVESGVPADVSYPPSVLADFLVNEFTAWLTKHQLNSSESSLIRRYGFDMRTMKKGSVETRDNNQIIPTSTVHLEYLKNR